MIFFISYHINDHQRNTRVIVDEQGNVKEYYDYYPFGKTLRSQIVDQSVATYKFTGKELDDENDLNWYDFGARYYDPRIGRFLSVDRFADKYPSLSPYQYCANNPLIFIDVNGDSIIVGHLDSETQTKLISDLSSKTGQRYYITSSGKLDIVPTITINGKTVQLASAYGNPGGSSGSAKAAKFVSSAIQSKNDVNVVAFNSGGSRGGGQLIKLDRTQIGSMIKGTPSSLDNSTMGFAMVFLHELVHTNIGQDYFNSLTPISDFDGSQTGPVVKFTNQIRKELGPQFGQRTHYLAIPMPSGMGSYIPFVGPTGKTKIIF